MHWPATRRNILPSSAIHCPLSGSSSITHIWSMRPLCSNSLALFFVPLLLKGLVYLCTPFNTCKKPSCSDIRISRLIVVEVIHLLIKAFGSHARKGFDVASKMRLVREVEG